MAICPAAVIAECDESLCGTNLTAAERALFTRRRKEAYEALHPETKHETFKGNQHTGSRQVGDNHTERFTADTAAKTGQSERAVQRDAARGKNIAPEVLTQIAGTKLDTGKTLDELASVPKEAQPTRLLSAGLHLDGEPGPCVYPPLMRQGGGRQLRRRTQANAA